MPLLVLFLSTSKIPIVALADDKVEFPKLLGAPLERGPDTWLGTCKNCHATGFADASPVSDFTSRAARLALSWELLYEHAIDGFYGEDYAHIPPRGGNAAPSNNDLMRAVDYVIALVNYKNKERRNDTGQN